HFKTIGDAVTAAAPGATIAIAEGTYAESVLATKELSFVGRCPSLTRIVEPPGEGALAPGIFVRGAAAKVSVRNLTVGGHYGGITIAGGADASIEEVVIDAAQAFGVLVDGATATVRRSKVLGTTVSMGRGGWGIAVGNGDATVEDVAIVGGTSAL